MSKREQLKALECRWKWEYLCKKQADGAPLTRHEEWSEVQLALKELAFLAHEPDQVDAWIKKHIAPQIKQTLQQTIRARRKRFFDAREQRTQKKSITLEYGSWRKLSQYAIEHRLTLSEAILKLLDQAAFKSKGVYHALEELAEEMDQALG